MDQWLGRSGFFKCELFQKAGSFKVRGALNAILSLDDTIARNGVVTHSSGNFAQALALGARLRGIPAHIVMPSSAPAVKQRAVAEYGGQIRLCEPTLEARERTAAQLVKETGGTLLHPFDHPDVIAGQGTIALELMEQVQGLDAVIVPVGGGGLISGIALALAELAPTVRVFGAEPLGADDAARSKAAGRLIPQTAPDTIADGLLTSLGQFTWPVVRDRVEEILVVDDREIREAQHRIWTRMKLLVEPSGAVPLAAARSDRFAQLQGVNRVAMVLSGGNLDFGDLLE
ncbi:MAG: serine dehydratase [Rickettsiales bacterium]|nr:serine dehydratase [Rickettsiales bacterium]